MNLEFVNHGTRLGERKMLQRLKRRVHRFRLGLLR